MNILNEMELKSVKENKDTIIVITTGAKYIIDKSGKKGKISCYQQLNKERLIASLDFNCCFSNLTVERKDETTCILFDLEECNYLRLQINSDSLLEIFSHGELSLTFSGSFLPDYSAEKNGNILLIDETGGIGLYPYKGLRNIESIDFTSKEWKIDYTLGRYSRFLVSVFPPRRFNHKQSLEERVAHHGLPDAPEYREGQSPLPMPLPSNDEIQELARYSNILVLHHEFWQGKLTRKGKVVSTFEDILINAAHCCHEYIPVDERELIRVIKKAHSLKMKVIPYMSPFYSTAKGKDFLDKIKEKLEQYNFDGVYFDGVYFDDILYSYSIIRETRRLLKDKILYYHCTLGSLYSRNIYCPFIDTYADYILRAESGAGFTDKHLRYVISGYNISNSIGYICYSTYPLDFIKKLIPKALASNKVWLYLGSPETEREKLLKKDYFPKLRRYSRKVW